MKNWKTKVISTALALSVLVPAASFAADTATTTGDVSFKRGFVHHQRFDNADRQAMEAKILEMVGKYAPESLNDWKSALAQRDQLVKELKEKTPARQNKPQLSDEVKEKIKAIREDVKSGKLTQEQAKEELKKLGLDTKFPGTRQELSDEVKEKVKAIREDVKNGKLTREQAGEELKKLGLDIKLPGTRQELSDEVKEKVKAIREDVKNGKLTREQAREELKKLGLEGKKNFAPENDLMHQFRKAVEESDETKIKELLPQLLQQLKDRNQQLSDRISKINQ